jgi:hypothetical protein
VKAAAFMALKRRLVTVIRILGGVETKHLDPSNPLAVFPTRH